MTQMQGTFIAGAEAVIGYVFDDKSLLAEALTHSSYVNELMTGPLPSYERIEFLGDAILGALCAEYLYDAYPGMSEGDMTQLRTQIICEAALAEAGRAMGLGRWLILGKGEENNGGRDRASIIADVVEALLGAVFRDGGMEPARDFARGHIFAVLEECTPEKDCKSILYEYVAQNALGCLNFLPQGHSGPLHAKTHHVELYLNDRKIGHGSGRNKKSAEQAAAAEALHRLVPECT